MKKQKIEEVGQAEVEQTEQTPAAAGLEILRAELDTLSAQTEWTQEERERRVELEGMILELESHEVTSPVCINTEYPSNSTEHINNCALENGVEGCLIIITEEMAKQAEAPCETCPDHAEEGCGHSVEDREECVENLAEAVNIDLPFSEEFMHNLPVFLTDVELGCYSKQQAKLWTQWGRLNQQKKDSAAVYKKQIESVESKLDDVSRIVEEGSEDRPVKCAWMFDYPQNEKILVRLDVNKIVERRTLTKEEIERYQNPELFGAETVEEAGEATDTPAEVVEGQEGTETDEITTIKEDTGDNSEGLCVLSPDDKPCTGCDECQTGEVEDLSAAPVSDADWPDPPPIDKNRNCCMPKDRAFHTEGNVRTNYCTVCKRIINKEDVSEEPYKNIPFVVGSMFQGDGDQAEQVS